MSFLSSEVLTTGEKYSIYVENLNGIFYDNTPGVQVIYVVDGGIKYKLKEELISVEEGELLILNQCENRFLYGEGVENFVLIFNVKPDYLKRLGELYYQTRYRNHVPRKDVRESVVNNLMLLYRMKMDRDDLDTRYSQVNQIVKTLIKNYSDTTNVIYGYEEKKEYLYTIEEMIADGNLENLNLKDLSEIMHLSQSYISRIFNELTGIKFTEYVQQLKLFHATLYMINTSKSLEQIAEIVDFGSTKSLNRIFNRYLDMTPSTYRKIYKFKDKNLKINDKFEDIQKHIKRSSYEEYVAGYFEKGELVIDVDAEVVTENFLNTWQTIRSLKSMGNDYLKIISDIADKIDIEEIILRFAIKKDDDGVEGLYLVDIDKKIELEDFHDLLDKCINYNITAIIGLDVGPLNLKEYGLNALKEKREIFSKFYKFVSRAVGTANMKRFKYIIDIMDIYKYWNMEDELDIYRNYICMQQTLLKEKVSSEDLRWGYDIGKINEDDLGKLRLIHNKFKDRKNDTCSFDPYFIVVNYINDGVEVGISIEEIQKIEVHLEGIIDRIGRIKKEVDFKGSKIYMKDSSKYIDISDLDPRYKDLFMTSLKMKLSFMFSDGKNYITDFTVVDRNQREGYYYPKLVDDYGFYTPFYWSLFLLKQIKGEVLLTGNGYLVTVNERDIFVLIYGNCLMSYLFAANKGFYNLKDDRYNLNFKIKGLDGKYKITTETVSYENGNALYNLGSEENYRYLTYSERKYIQKLSIPNFKMEIKDIEGTFRDRIEYSPFEIVLKKFTRI